jgi:uncharacterized protein
LKFVFFWTFLREGRLDDSGMRELIEAVQAALAGIDRPVEAFEGATGLRCLAGCGACCETPEVETTALELLPLAFELVRAGTAEAWLQRARAAAGQRCVNYLSDPGTPGKGRCEAYGGRPAICRLFGSTARIRDGRTELVTCRVKRRETPDRVAAAEAAIDVAPLLADLARTVTSLDPVLGRERLPINEALARAIERVGLWWSLEGGGGDTPRRAP